MQEKKELFLTIEEKEIYPNEEIHGRIELNYNGRFDTIVINSHIENSSDICNYIELNGKKINHPYSRLSIYKKDLEEKRIINFIAITQHIPKNDFSKVKFRTSIIQEHKEVANDILILKIKKDVMNNL
ncbi:MAG TPA: hypothetical protein VFR65_00105 [Nitrososphaeraceae archaeon]|nr:hypothetical protein [Nitrososphaeraceae archaeon]